MLSWGLEYSSFYTMQIYYKVQNLRLSSNGTLPHNGMKSPGTNWTMLHKRNIGCLTKIWDQYTVALWLTTMFLDNEICLLSSNCTLDSLEALVPGPVWLYKSALGQIHPTNVPLEFSSGPQRISFIGMPPNRLGSLKPEMKKVLTEC